MAATRAGEPRSHSHLIKSKPITETNGMDLALLGSRIGHWVPMWQPLIRSAFQLDLFGMQNKTLGPYMAANNAIRIPATALAPLPLVAVAKQLRRLSVVSQNCSSLQPLPSRNCSGTLHHDTDLSGPQYALCHHAVTHRTAQNRAKNWPCTGHALHIPICQSQCCCRQQVHHVVGVRCRWRPQAFQAASWRTCQIHKPVCLSAQQDPLTPQLP
jgi:hypothetical protein